MKLVLSPSLEKIHQCQPLLLLLTTLSNLWTRIPNTLIPGYGCHDLPLTPFADGASRECLDPVGVKSRGHSYTYSIFYKLPWKETSFHECPVVLSLCHGSVLNFEQRKEKCWECDVLAQDSRRPEPLVVTVRFANQHTPMHPLRPEPVPSALGPQATRVTLPPGWWLGAVVLGNSFARGFK